MGCSCKYDKIEDKMELLKQPQEIRQIKINSIINIQSHVRGYLLRKNLYEKYVDLMKDERFSSSKDSYSNYIFLYENLDENKNTSNPTNKITEEDMSYLFSNYPPLDDGVKVELKSMTDEGDFIFYHGERDEDGNKHGRGVQLWANGTKYYGYWINNKVNKKGKLIHKEGDVYEGEWVDFKAEGYGTYTTLNGTKYEGYWLADKQHGKGMEEWPEGNMYIGEYSQGVKNGKGKFIWNDGAIYQGDFVNKTIEGKGIYIWPDKKEYNGDWKNNKMNGYGEFTWPDGRIYKGEYKNDKKEGYGIFAWPNGKKYKGYWKNGKQNGEGELYSPNTNVWNKYIWKDGEIINKCI